MSGRPKGLSLWQLWRAIFSREMWALIDHGADCKRCRRLTFKLPATGYCTVGQPLADRVRARHGITAGAGSGPS